MDIVKKNLISIICGVIALAALVAIYIWPLDNSYEELKKKTQERAARYGQLAGLINKTRSLPTFDLETAQPVPLREFPTRTIIELGQAAQKNLDDESKKMYRAAVDLNMPRDPAKVTRAAPYLIIDGILGRSAVSGAAATQFRPRLQAMLDSLRNDVLVAGIPPTEEEVKKRSEEIRKKWEAKLMISPTGEAINKDQIEPLLAKELSELPDLMQKEMAAKKKIYVDPAVVMKVPQYLPAREVPDPSMIWWAHVEFWITRDIVETIAAINADAKSVTESPVKHLLAIKIPIEFYPGSLKATTGGGPRTPGAEEEAPAAGGLPDPKLPVPGNATLSPTKRISNNLYDVCRFEFSIDLEAQQVPRFIRMLTSKRFISVLRFNITAVDSQLKQIEKFVYGPRPVVTLDLECEALFLRSWTLPLMPTTVKRQLGIEAAPGARPDQNQ